MIKVEQTVIWKDIIILTRRELTSAFRESSVILYSVLLPFLFYPFILWLIVTTMSFVQGLQERSIPVIAYEDNLGKQLGVSLFEMLNNSDKIKLTPHSDTSGSEAGYDAWLSVNSTTKEPRLEIKYRQDREVSVEALNRIKKITRSYNLYRQKQWLSQHHLPAQIAHPFDIETHSSANSTEVGGYVLGALLPVGLLIMITLGGSYPAIDTTAGERERGTWETLQSCAPGMGKIVVSKYLFVCVVCCISGLLNMLAMLVSIRSILAPMIRDNNEISFNIGLSSLLILVGGIILISLLIGAALLLCAVFARTFREGQALVTPIFMLITLPLLPLSDPNLQITNSLAMIPLINLTLVWRQALLGHFVPFHILATLLSLVALIAICLYLGSKVLASESIMSGSILNNGIKGLIKSKR